MDIIKDLVPKLEEAIQESNLERERLGSLAIPFGEVKLLGQFGLMSHPVARQRFNLRATRDVDAIFNRTSFFGILFAEVVKSFGFEFDELSQEAWLPPHASYDELYSGQFFRIDTLKPRDILISKAVKAPEKNAPLIVEALKEFGKEFENDLIKYGANLEFFRKFQREKNERR